MSVLRVVAAVILFDGRVLSTCRGYGEFRGLWEFPGGKVESGESCEEALVREIKEELDVEVIVDGFALNVKYSYPGFDLDMDCFVCHLLEGEHISLLEHEDAKWLSKDDLDGVNWIPADLAVVDYLRGVL